MAPSATRLLGFRWHLMALAVVSVLPLVLFGASLVRRSAVEERARTERTLTLRAALLAAAVDRELAASMRAVETLARSEHLARGDLAGFRREAVRVGEVQPSWFAVVLFTPDGRRILDTRDPAPTGTTVDPAGFSEALRTGGPAIGDLVHARDGSTWAFAVRTAVPSRGAVRYVLAAAISASEIARTVAIGGVGDLEWSRTVMDRAGTIVAHTRSPEQTVGRRADEGLLARVADPDDSEGVFRSRTVEGVASVIGWARAPLSGWTACIVATAELVDAPVRRSTLALALTGLGSLVLSAGAAFLLSRRFGRAIASAADAAQTLAAGGPVAVTPCGIREVARLGDALASTSGLLEARREAVDRHLAQAAAARREAEESSRAKDEFLAMLGHELRNPLSPILTALHLLRQRGTGWGREHEIIARQVNHLVRLVDDLLDVSRLTRAKIRLHRERIELAAVVSRAVEMASPLLEERRHRLALDVPTGLVVDGDPVRLAQVFGNLLTNAARYTPPGGHVSVTARRDGDGAAVEVADDGQGIAPELLPRVFELFVQGPRGPDRAQGGLGIGLALVKSLVTLHGGTVEARSEGPGRGSTFRVRLPLASAREVAPVLRLASPQARAARPLRVLVVDDKADAAAHLADLLARAGHEVQVAHDGPAALAAADALRPEVAILDLGLPVMDGYEVASQLRQRLGADAPVLLAMTGYGQERDCARSLAAGFLRHFVKPAEPAELLAALEEAGGGAARRAPG